MKDDGFKWALAAVILLAMYACAGPIVERVDHIIGFQAGEME